MGRVSQRRSSGAGGLPTVSSKLPIAEYPALPLPDAKLGLLVDDAKDWAQSHGITMRSKESSTTSDVVEFAPFTLLPSQVPSDLFLEALAVQKDMNLLYANVSSDYEFLKNTLENVVKTDVFVRRLFEIFEKVHKDNYHEVFLNIMRSDYMVHEIGLASNADSLGEDKKGHPDASGSDAVDHDASKAYKTTAGHSRKRAKIDHPPTKFLKQIFWISYFTDFEKSLPCLAYRRTATARKLQVAKVEINAIAASLAGLSSQLLDLHKMMLHKFGFGDVQIRQVLPQENNSAKTLAQGLVAAWREYGDISAVILFVVEDETRNISDQRFVEYAIAEESGHQAQVVRLSFKEIAKFCHWDEAAKLMTVSEPEEAPTKAEIAIDGASKVEPQQPPKDEDSKSESEQQNNVTEGKHDEATTSEADNKHMNNDHVGTRIKFGRQIAVVYYRTGYVPEQYSSDKDWEIREQLERSRAIKCPPIGFQLAGTKKVQQELVKSGVLDKFVKTKKSAEAIRATFMPMFGFDDPEESKQTLELIRAQPKNYVLKPQLEGGGNNIYGENILKFIDGKSEDELKAFIAMERIFPPVQKNYILRANCPPLLDECIVELSVYGYYLGTKLSIKANIADGYLLRTKSVHVDEGGVMAGASGLDTPFFVKE